MSSDQFDSLGRFIIHNYAAGRPFASFLPGIAGPLGVPLWAFYVNRGQAMASFGLETKDNPILEFQPANRAYQATAYTGFRTFLKWQQGAETVLYEPFAPWSGGDEARMFVGMNELEIEAHNEVHGLRTNVLYFILPGEPFGGLVRQVTVTNTGDETLRLEMLDGLPQVMPYGVDNRSLKEIGRTLEAWMGVSLEEGVPFYRFQASSGDTARVSEIRAGHFYLAFDGAGQALFPLVDPVVVFDQNTALNRPDGFARQPLAEMGRRRQITTGRTPCGFVGSAAVLAPGGVARLYAIVGHAGSAELLHRQRPRLARPAYVQQKRQEAGQLVEQLTGAVATRSASPLFDAYTRQSFLDNVLRGGWPLMLEAGEPVAYHIYSRKHGDLERDYNYFYVAAEPYSQGNANYRDVNQNRRNDVLLEPRLADFDVLAFLGLIQADGYNPLVVDGLRFSLPAGGRAAVLALVEQPAGLAPILAQPFTPGRLLRAIADGQLGLKVAPEAFVAAALARAEPHFEAAFGEGYWIDHWTYNLDLIDAYLAVYPDRQDELLFGQAVVPYFDSPAVVQPRARKYVLEGDRVRQYGAVVHDEGKAALIAARGTTPNLVRCAHGRGAVYRTTVFAKLLGLALLKFSSLDPLGLGIEMEAGRPGWYDALNGLPGLFGSSLCGTYELERLLSFLLEATAERSGACDLPLEQAALLDEVVQALAAWRDSDDPQRDFHYWDAATTARETYRAATRLGFAGETVAQPFDRLAAILEAFKAKVHSGIERAVQMNAGLPPTYLAYTVTEHEPLAGDDGQPRTDGQGRPYVRARRFEPRLLPPFLEGPVHALKRQPDAAAARDLYARVRESELYDRQLGMYKVNAPLVAEPHEIGRARAFTPGWLENESIWLHMEYKYLLEVLRAGLYPEFLADLQRCLIPFQDPAVYGRSPLENSSFLVSSAHPDVSLHGAGFVARLSGATAEFLSIWGEMMAGPRPFTVRDGKLALAFRPTLPGWLFDESGTLSFTFLGRVQVVYHNPARRDILPGQGIRSLTLHLPDGRQVACAAGVVGEPYAQAVRQGRVTKIEISFQDDRRAIDRKERP